MLATTSELKTTARAGLVVRIHKVSITLATSNLDQIGLDLDLEWVLFEFYKFATTTVDAKGRFEVLGSTVTERYIRNSLVTIHQIDMVGLLVLNIPNSSFLHGDHTNLEKDAGLDRYK